MPGAIAGVHQVARLSPVTGIGARERERYGPPAVAEGTLKT
ncbi:hypothetical protein J2S46_007302 [Kitasatospora herbaricolor]|nr:hypothetical protein [Kitasatospora herbaricolor]MDQ0312746.1 hypothetical protein [Kitasatospora herbaricolor]